MSTKPKPKITNPIMAQILARYVGADSVGGSPPDAKPADNSTNSNESDWYNMACPRCPWFFDGEKRGLYAVVDAVVNDKGCDMGNKDSDAPDNAHTAGKAADGDSGRLNGDGTPWGDERDALLEGVNDGSAKNSDIIGRPDSHQVPIVRCERPESQECPGESFCVKLLVARDLIRQQAALQRMMAGLAPGVDIAGAGDADRKLTEREKRSLTLRRASKKRGR